MSMDAITISTQDVGLFVAALTVPHSMLCTALGLPGFIDRDIFLLLRAECELMSLSRHSMI